MGADRRGHRCRLCVGASDTLSLILTFLKNVGILVGGTILVFLAFFAVVVPLMLLSDAIKGRGRRRNSPGPSEFGRSRGRMARAALPTLLLTPAKKPGFSKLGGAPELPCGTDWPIGHCGPRAFVAQIDLKAVRQHGGPDWLGHEGRLYAFVDEDQHGYADVVRIIHSSEPPGPARAAAPSRGEALPERRIAFEAYKSVPSLEWLGIDLTETNVSNEELDHLAGAPDAPFGDEIQHRIGGYPSEIQDERMAISCELMRRGLPPEYEGTEITPAIERASKQWRMLLQLDSDPALRMNWGDGGRLYVFIREKDALKGDFSQTVTISQSY